MTSETKQRDLGSDVCKQRDCADDQRNELHDLGIDVCMQRDCTDLHDLNELHDLGIDVDTFLARRRELEREKEGGLSAAKAVRRARQQAAKERTSLDDEQARERSAKRRRRDVSSSIDEKEQKPLRLRWRMDDSDDWHYENIYDDPYYITEDGRQATIVFSTSLDWIGPQRL